MITIKCPNCGKGFTTTEHTWSEVIEIGKAYFKRHNEICEKDIVEPNCEVALLKVLRNCAVSEN